jgi:hypothetical protein
MKLITGVSCRYTDMQRYICISICAYVYIYVYAKES